MGVDHTVLLVYGLRVKRSLLMEEYETPSCSHPKPSTTIQVAGKTLSSVPKFCQECGRANTTYKSTRWRKQFEAFAPYEDKIGGYELVNSDCVSGEGAYYLGEVIWFDQYKNSLKIEVPDLSELRLNMESVLAPLGLWDETEFGVWLANRWS